MCYFLGRALSLYCAVIDGVAAFGEEWGGREVLHIWNTILPQLVCQGACALRCIKVRNHSQ